MKYSCIFIGVNYKTSSETIKWVESINALDKRDGILIIVVDNSCESIDLSLKDNLLSLDKRLVYIDTGENVGYLPGASKGIEYLKANGIESDYIVVCNVDIRFKTRNMIEILRENTNENIGVFSPSIVNEDGKEGDLNPYSINRLSKRQMKNRIMYFKYPQFRFFADLLRCFYRIIKDSRSASWPSGTKMFMTYGACFIFSKEFFIKGGDLDTPLPLYMEEPYIGEKCSTLHLDTVYLPEIVISNVGHVSTGKINSKEKDRIFLNVTTLLYKLYYTNSSDDE